MDLQSGIRTLLLIICTLYTTLTVAQEGAQGTSWTRLDQPDPPGFSDLRDAFVKRNPGYDLSYHHEVSELSAKDAKRVCFVQKGGGTAAIGAKKSKFSVGDIILLNPTEEMTTDSLTNILAFTVPTPFPAEIPTFVRPDWDPNITDTPGGCATETNAYRRILLTWLDKVGPYRFHALNAHRVRIMDSFTHYHPQDKGFDEFYLVQMVLPEARLITSSSVQIIEQPNQITPDQANQLLHETKLQVGDLVYMPRGIVHRGLGGVLAQVITVPGFVPGSEIGVDHHLKAINEKLELTGRQQLPYNRLAARTVTIK